MIATDIIHRNDHLIVYFRLTQSQSSLVELDVWPLTDGSGTQNYIAEIEKIIDNGRYGVPLHADCEECHWHQLIAVVNRCRDEARNLSGKVLTNLHIREAEHGLSAKKLEILSTAAPKYMVRVSSAT